MPRRRPECGAARAVGGTGPGGGRIRTGRSRPPRPELQRYRGAGARREAGPPMRETRRRRGPQGAKKAASAPRCTNGPQGRTKVGRTCRRDLRRTGGGCRSRRGARRKAHAAAEELAGQGADAGVAEEPAGQGTDAEATEVPAEAAKTARAAPCTGGASVPAKSDAERKPDPSHRPTSARLSPDFRPTFAGRARAASGASHRANGPAGKNKSPRLHSVGLFG